MLSLALVVCQLRGGPCEQGGKECIRNPAHRFPHGEHGEDISSGRNYFFRVPTPVHIHIRRIASTHARTLCSPFAFFKSSRSAHASFGGGGKEARGNVIEFFFSSLASMKEGKCDVDDDGYIALG